MATSESTPNSEFHRAITATLGQVDAMKNALIEMRDSIGRIARIELTDELRLEVTKQLDNFVRRMRSSESVNAFQEAASAFIRFELGLTKPHG